MAAGWTDERAQRLVELVTDQGLTVTPEAARVIVTDQVAVIAARMRITDRAARRYLTDDVLATMADQIMVSLADEDPGADPLRTKRDTTIAVADFGRLVAGLSESSMDYAGHPAVDDTERHLRTSEIMSMLSVCGLLAADHTNRRHPRARNVPRPRRPHPGQRGRDHRQRRPRGSATARRRHGTQSPTVRDVNRCTAGPGRQSLSGCGDHVECVGGVVEAHVGGHDEPCPDEGGDDVSYRPQDRSVPCDR